MAAYVLRDERSRSLSGSLWLGAREINIRNLETGSRASIREVRSVPFVLEGHGPTRSFVILSPNIFTF